MLNRHNYSKKNRVYLKSVGGSYNRVITFTHVNPDDAKVLLIRIWNGDDGMQSVRLEFNNNTTMRQFFISCPIEWRNLVRNPNLESYPEHEPQINFDKDVSSLKHAHFRIKIADNHCSHKGSDPVLSYCEVDDHVNCMGRPLEEVENPSFSISIKYEKNKKILKQLIATIKEFIHVDEFSLTDLQKQFITVEDLVAIADVHGVSSAVAHVNKSLHKDYLLCGLANYYFSNSSKDKPNNIQHARDCVDIFYLSDNNSNYYNDALKMLYKFDMAVGRVHGCNFDEYKIFHKYDLQARKFAQRQAALQPKTSSMTLF